MRLPIRYALNYPVRYPSKCEKLSISKYSELTFEAPDMEKFPLLRMAFEAIAKGGNAACALNAANEIAVAAFLQEKIRFVDIPHIVAKAISGNTFVQNPSYEDYVATNDAIREIAASLI